MSTDTIRTILARAMAEPPFRALLLRDPAQALAGYDLAAAEIAALSSLKLEGFEAGAAELEARLSRSTIAGGDVGGDSIKFASNDIGMDSDVAHGTEFGDSDNSAELRD